MVARLVESIQDESAELIVDLGTNTEIPDDEIEDFELVNAQLHVLHDGMVMVRRSRRHLQQLRLLDHSEGGLKLDLWQNDWLFDDSTDGHLFKPRLHFGRLRGRGLVARRGRCRSGRPTRVLLRLRH